MGNDVNKEKESKETESKGGGVAGGRAKGTWKE